jgi:LDH2 family malate/lactate/ureidoglycolate dehydrogenase
MRTVSSKFLHFAICEVFTAAGASQRHAKCVADGILFGHMQGKDLQGLGVYEALDIPLRLGCLDLTAVPEVISEGNAWAVVDGRQSSGYYTLNVMTDVAMEKARTSGIAIVFGGNHNDAGSFSSYVYRAQQQGFFAMASNNTVPLAAPWGGKENRLSCPPFDAMTPNGQEPPLWTSTMLAEFYDAHVAQAVHENKELDGPYAIDIETGETTSDIKQFAQKIEGYARVYDANCAGQLSTPRMYALNLWNEALTSIINPLGIPSTELPSVEDYANGTGEGQPSVGGSYILCIDPSVMMQDGLNRVKEKSDRFVARVKDTPHKPDESVRLPGQDGYELLQQAPEDISVIEQHWDAFFNFIAARFELSESMLRERFEAQQNSAS